MKIGTLTEGHAVAFDFDGVIHKYSKGWQDGSIYDEANYNVLELIRILLNAGYPCMIISTRDPQQIKEWWDKQQFGIKAELLDDDTKFFNDCSYVGITNRKLPAQVYVDDRAYKYTGQSPKQFFRDFRDSEMRDDFYMDANSLNAVQGAMRHEIHKNDMKMTYDCVDHLFAMVLNLGRRVEELEGIILSK